MIKIILNGGEHVNTRGLFSLINQYLATCYYYDNKNQEICVNFDLINKSSYYDKSITETNNVWEYFFEINKNFNNISNFVEIFWTEIHNFYGYDFDFNNKEERKKSEEIIKKFLIIKEHILKKIDKYYDENFKGKKILGVHKRGTDIGEHFKVKKIEDFFYEIDLIKDDYDFIFLSTDERSVIDAFNLRYKNVIYYSYDSLSNNPNLPNFKILDSNIYKMGEDTLIDSLLLSKTNFLIQTNSNLSNFSLLANSQLKFKRIL